VAGTLKHIAKHSAIYAMGDILAKTVGFLLLPLYTRTFSIPEYGILSLIIVLNTLPSRFISQGINTWAIKAITLDYQDDPTRRRIAISTAHYYLILSGVVVNSLLILSIPLLGRWVLKSGNYNHLLACAFASSVLETAQMIPLNVLLRARFRSVLYSVLSFGQFLMSVGLNIYFIVYLESGIGGIIYTDLIVAFVVATVSFFVIWPELVPVFSWSEVRQMVRYGWPLIPARASMWLLDFVDRFQLQRLSTIVEVGLYSAGTKYAKIFQFLYLAQFEKVWPSVFFPLSREAGAERKLSRLFTYLFLVACGLGLAVILFVEPIVKMTLERSYWRASRVVGWLVMGFILEATYQVFTVGLRVHNQTRYMPLIVGSGAAFNILANLWVLPRWGMVGAGFTTFCANAILVVLGYYYSNRVYPVPYEWRRLIHIASLFTALFVIDSVWSPENLVVSIPFKILELLAFPLVLWMMGLLNEEEIRSLLIVVRGFGQRAGQALRLSRALPWTEKVE
jgi:O-antigen/teichoic acid export membrane protein